MPVCSGCGASFEDSFQFCPHCGRSKPKPQELHVVTREEIPANACPVCRRNDRVEKISARYAGDTHQLSGSTSSTNTYVDKDGHTRHESHDNPFSGVQQSNLASYLTPPKQPEKKGACLRYILIWPFLSAVIVGLGQFLIAVSPNSDQRSGFMAVFTLAVVIGSGYGIYWVFSSAKKKNREAQQKQEMEMARWNKAMSRWQQAYYCQRDDVVYIPGSQNATPLQQMTDLLYQ